MYVVQSTMLLTPLNRQDDSFYCCLVNSLMYAYLIKVLAMVKTTKKAGTLHASHLSDEIS